MLAPRTKNEKSIESPTYDQFFYLSWKKIIVSCLAPLIMKKLYEVEIISPSTVISMVRRQFNIGLSPGTVYAVFFKLEREGNIERLVHKTNRLYTLTPKGRERIEYFNSKSIFVRMLSLY
jgi:hypothetical protein